MPAEIRISNISERHIALIDLDADDMLWTHSDYSAAGIDRFVDLLGDIDADARRALIDTTLANLAIYGFGAQGLCAVD